MRVYVYVDGFNLYYRALQRTQHKWLDLNALSQRLLRPGDTVDCIRYFSARVKARAGDPDAPRRQQIYLSALGTIPNIEFHFGNFLTKKKMRPLVSVPTRFVEVFDTEEKGSDVNLAVHLVNDAWSNRFDVALVLSQDTDLIEPLRIVSQERGKKVGLIWLDSRRPDHGMARASTFVRHVTPADLAASQLTDPVPRANGAPIAKPASW
jgi:hypothetical protein